jgi:hypothetical protein
MILRLKVYTRKRLVDNEMATEPDRTLPGEQHLVGPGFPACRRASARRRTQERSIPFAVHHYLFSNSVTFRDIRPKRSL